MDIKIGGIDEAEWGTSRQIESMPRTTAIKRMSMRGKDKEEMRLLFVVEMVCKIHN